MQSGILINNEFMLQKNLSSEEAGEVWRALEFNAGYVVQLHFIPQTNLSAARIKKRIQEQIKHWQASQKPGLVLPVRWNETSEGRIFLVSPHIEGVLPEHYAAQWIQESFTAPQPTKAEEQDVYSLAEKIVPSDVLRFSKKKEAEELPLEEPDTYRSVITAARSASAPKLLAIINRERRFHRALRIFNVCLLIAALSALVVFREHLVPYLPFSFGDAAESVEEGELEREPLQGIDDIVKPLNAPENNAVP